jgi:hypothetical protein
MLGSKSQNAIRPVALGTTVNSGAYGQTIPLLYGVTKGAMYLIWMANIRQGSGKKSKKSKAPPDYVANVDWLLCHNPVMGVLQSWVNQNQWLVLNFQKYSASLGYSGNSEITVPDSRVYYVLAVTATIPYGSNYNTGADSVTFNDYGGQGSSTLSGSYEIPLWNMAYNGPDPMHASGCRWAPWAYWWTPGSGATVLLPYLGIAEMGLSLTINVYYAQIPGFNEITTNGLQSAFGLNGSKANADTPIGALNLQFEPSLGDGPEFFGTDSTTGNLLTDQRIIYPHYAGAGSAEMAMGSGQMFPNVQPEILGAFPLNPNSDNSADADFADMVEDLFYGATQAGFGNDNPQSPIQHGLNCGQRPGTVQQADFGGGSPFVGSAPTWTYSQPNVAGDWLIVCAAVGSSSAPLTISDTAANSWTALFSGENTFQVWYAQAKACNVNDHGTAVTVTLPWYGEPASEVSLFEIAGVDTLDAVVTAMGNSAEITTTGAQATPMYIFAFGEYLAAGGVPPWGTVNPPTLWQYLLYPDRPAGTAPGGPVSDAPDGGGVSYVPQCRIVQFPGTYRYTAPTVQASGARNAGHVALLAFKCSQPPNYPPALGNIIGDIIDKPSLQVVRNQCRAAGLWGSLFLDSQTKGSDIIGQLYDAMDAWPVWSGFSLKSIARSEVSAVGNGAAYYAPTAPGPIVDLTEADFNTGGKSDTAPVTVTRKAQVNVPDILSVQHPNRASQYNDIVVSQPESGAVALYGPRKDSPKRMPMFQSPAVSRMYLDIQVRLANYVRNQYEFPLMAKWKLLESGDLVTIPLSSTMPDTQGPGGTTPIPYTKIPLRILSIDEDETYGLKATAEPFIYGCYAPLGLPATQQQGYIPQTGGNPGSVNPPIIFEPVPRLCGGNTQAELWLVVSGGATTGSPPVTPNYGGCFVYVSTDGGSSFNPAAPLSNSGSVVGGDSAPASSAIMGNAITGWLTAPWDAAVSPDTTNNLQVDLSESHGSLESYSVTDEDAATYPCYVAGGANAPLLQQSIGQAGRGYSSLAEPFANLNNAGNVIYVIVAAQQDGYESPAPTVTDSNLNTYALIDSTPKELGPGVADQVFFFAAVNIAGGANTITVTTTAPADYQWAALEYSDVLVLGSPPAVLPTVVVSNQGSVTPLQAGAFQIPVAGGVVLAFGCDFENSTDALGLNSEGSEIGNWTLRQSVGNPPGTAGQGVLKVWDAPSGLRSAAELSLTGNFSSGQFHVGAICIEPARTLATAPTGIPYELMSYAVANLTAPYQYELMATATGSPPEPNHLDRGVLGAPAPNQGVFHTLYPITYFAFVGPPYPGIFKLALDPKWIGQTLFFKFAAFNSFVGNIQDLSDCIAYQYTPSGVAGSASGNPASYSVTPTNPTTTTSGSPPVVVTDEDVLSNPTATTILMAQTTVTFPSNSVVYNSRTFTIPNPTAPTTYYITITDPGYTGDQPGQTNLAAICQTSNALVGVPGNTYIGSIVAMPGGGGTIVGPGGSAGISGSVLLETDGVPNSSQALLNLIEGAGVTLTDGGGGSITIAATALTYVSETPAGTLNGVNKTFTLSCTPSAGSLKLFLNGVEQLAIGIGSPPVVDYSLIAATIAFTVAPKSSDELIAQYTHV